MSINQNIRFHATKNSEITVDSVLSSQEIWWECSQGHEWARVVRKQKQINTCPYCSGKRILAGFNDLATTHPGLAGEWHHTLNSIQATEVSAGSNRKIWWLGECGHEWETTVKNRTSGRGCPVCSNKKVIQGVNDLATTHPETTKLWDDQKNNTPATTISAGSKKVFWWVCEENHSYQKPVTAVTSSSRPCPTCFPNERKYVSKQLVSDTPDLNKIWDPLLNKFTPDQISLGSNRKIWWLGECGHSWETTPQKQLNHNCCLICKGTIILPGFNDFKTKHPELVKEWNNNKNNYSPSEVSAGSGKKAWWVCDKGHEWETRISDRVFYQTNCPTCSVKKFQSKPEKAIADWLTKTGYQVETSVRSIIPQELDIYLPQYRIAVEFNGLYWHDENHKPRNYHYDKWLACKNHGIQLIQIWEDDWNRNPDLIKNLILFKTNQYAQKKIFARKTSAIKVSPLEAKDFLTKHHIQGYAKGAKYVGLKSENQLVAVLGYRLENHTKDTLNILRYATSVHVPGGFTKLLATLTLNHVNQIISFSDNTVSDGNLYQVNGFKAMKHLPPDYTYFYQGERHHKFNFRLERFKTDPHFVWVEGKTERELAILNNIPRIWDAGKTKWVKNL